MGEGDGCIAENVDTNKLEEKTSAGSKRGNDQSMGGVCTVKSCTEDNRKVKQRAERDEENSQNSVTAT